MEEKDLVQLRQIYSEICRGFSLYTYNNECFYIKHIGILERSLVDQSYMNFFDQAIEKGFQTEKDKLEWLKEKGLWTIRDEVDIQKIRDYIGNLEKTKRNCFQRSQIKSIEEQINQETEKLLKLTRKRKILVKLCAEEVAIRKTQYVYLNHLFYKDEDLKIKSFSDGEIDEADDLRVSVLLGFYNEVLERFSIANVKRISLQSFFTNSFYLCQEYIGQFFSKPMAFLTDNQTNLLTYGLYFKNITANHKIPSDIQEDPEKIEDFVNRSDSLNKIIDKTGNKNGQSVGLFGVSDQDFRDLNIKDSTNEMRNLAQKNHKNAMEIVRSK